MTNSPLREALSRLAAERLAVLSSNCGSTVAPRLTREGYHQLIDLHHLLEIHALEVAVVDSAAVDRVVQILSRMATVLQSREYPDSKVFSWADREFHHGLVSIFRNEFLIRAEPTCSSAFASAASTAVRASSTAARPVRSTGRSLTHSASARYRD